MSYSTTYQVQNEGSKRAFFGYRYAFQRQERDDELKGVGNSYDFGARIYDLKLGRWLARDPREAKYEYASGYSFVLNHPTVAIVFLG